MQQKNDDAIERRNALVEQWLWLVDAIAKSLMVALPPCFDFEDLRQAGALGLMNAAERYNPTLGVPFRAYAALRIRGEILESTRRRRWTEATHLPITAEVFARPGSGAEDVEAKIMRRERANLIAAAVEGLTPNERKALDIYYRQEGKLAGVGDALGYRQSRSSQVLHIARKALVRELKWRGVAIDIETGCTAAEMSDAAYEQRASRPRRSPKAA